MTSTPHLQIPGALPPAEQGEGGSFFNTRIGFLDENEAGRPQTLPPQVHPSPAIPSPNRLGTSATETMTEDVQQPALEPTSAHSDSADLNAETGYSDVDITL